MICDGTILIPGVNDLQHSNPELAAELSPNNELAADQIFYKARFPVLWRCPVCKDEYKKKVCSREVGDDSCMVCSGKKLLPGFNSLDVTKPDLVPEWSVNNPDPMSSYMQNSWHRALWICSVCGGEYSSIIREREKDDDACPYCRMKKILPGINSLEITNPELMSRWSSNNEEPMSHYLNNSCYRALWICPDCGGEYVRSIRDMATGNVDCVYCSMKEVLPGVNSFAVLHPDLMNEWNHLDNYLLCDPDQILDNCVTPVWWTCPVCAHDYKCSPKQSTVYKGLHRVTV